MFCKLNDGYRRKRTWIPLDNACTMFSEDNHRLNDFHKCFQGQGIVSDKKKCICSIKEKYACWQKILSTANQGQHPVFSIENIREI